MNKELFSSKSDEWQTPTEVFDFLNSKYQFNLDAAASKENHLCQDYFSLENSALINDWVGSVFCNPPYSKRNQKDFLIKAITEIKKEATDTIVMVMPARFDTRNWHEYVFPNAAEVWFIKGRLKFKNAEGAQAGAPFPSCIVVFKKTDRYIDFRTWDTKSEPQPL